MSQRESIPQATPNILKGRVLTQAEQSIASPCTIKISIIVDPPAKGSKRYRAAEKITKYVQDSIPPNLVGFKVIEALVDTIRGLLSGYGPARNVLNDSCDRLDPHDPMLALMIQLKRANNTTFSAHNSISEATVSAIDWESLIEIRSELSDLGASLKSWDIRQFPIKAVEKAIADAIQAHSKLSASS